MLIITADDYGKTGLATDSILNCFCNKRITTASVMVFMEDSERAAELAKNTKLELGLHLNFTLPFNAINTPRRLREHQTKILSYLRNYRLSQVIYNPFLASSFSFVFESQKEEFLRLYGRLPDFYNGHHHMHLCANVLASKMLPNGARVRRTFTFAPTKKNPLNWIYRSMLGIWLSKRFILTDWFFSITPFHDYERLREIVDHAVKDTVEVEVHPEIREETEFLLGCQFLNLINSTHCGGFLQLPVK